jgi:hypothetical protein
VATSSAKAAIDTPCLICDTDNQDDAILCSHCFAPMALVHDAVAQDRDPQIVSVIGESNVGKTVYLGFLLDMLSQRAGDFLAVPRGAYSVDLQQTVVSHMAARIFPPKTPMEAHAWYWAYYQVRRNAAKSPWVDLVMPDMAGESLAAEIATPATFAVIQKLLDRSAGLILLVDSAMAASGYSHPDFFALKLLSYIDAMQKGGDDGRVETPTAIVLCKADHCPECFNDPRQFAKANLNRLWNMCERRFENVEFFACSTVGSLGYAGGDGDDSVTPIPLHTALHGVLEPFEWILEQF